MLGIGILAGLIPCPFTVAVLLLAITHGLILPGLAVVSGIIAGTFVLLCVVGLVTIKARGIAGRSKKQSRQAAMHRGMGILGGALVLTAGVMLALLYYPAYTR
jgi:ABC-type nickel/cobalt efflux system permease component RcnA